MSNPEKVIADGGIIAYPTEAVYGLGCDPYNEAAVRRLCDLKRRSLDKGLILIASEWQQIQGLVEDIPQERAELIQQSWPGPVTWLFPASDKAPAWICGDSDKIALRITAHPIARDLCQRCDQALVSTSANLATQDPCKDAETVKKVFQNALDDIITGNVGDLGQPTTIRDAITGAILR